MIASDLHFSHKCPIARSAEEDWYKAQGRVLEQIRYTCGYYGYAGNDLPFIVCGDLVDKPEQPPELINFLLKYLPELVFAVPGQHDLMHYNLDDIHKSAYWTLVQSGKVNHIDGPRRLPNGTRIMGFPWGREVSPAKKPGKKSIAIIHAYVWMKGKAYAGVEMDSSVKSWAEKLEGYTSAFFGDNHKAFTCLVNEPLIVNCGCCIRRKADEMTYVPQIYLLHESGASLPIPLPTDQDKWLDIDKALAIIETGAEVEEFIEQLASLGGTALNFIDAVMEFLRHHKIGGKVRDKLTKLMESKR